ncbi:MAG TPA: hypothetical protein VK151_19030 [Fluviicola sp.]|nr:hypothetical protein [Fluviicola sp.]
MQKWIPVLLLLCLFSCTIEKRLYRPGYSVEWKHCRQTVKNETAVLRLEEENNLAVAPEEPVMEEQLIDSRPAVAPESSEPTTVEQATHDSPLKKAHSFVKTQRKAIPKKIKTMAHDDPEEEKREPKYANGFVQFLAIFLGIIVGIVASVFFILLIFIGGDLPVFKSNDRKPDDYKTFRSVFRAAFRITFMIASALLITAILVLLAIALYQAYGIWALIGAIVGIILLILLVSFVFDKMFDFVFHDR